MSVSIHLTGWEKGQNRVLTCKNDNILNSGIVFQQNSKRVHAAPCCCPDLNIKEPVCKLPQATDRPKVAYLRVPNLDKVYFAPLEHDLLTSSKFQYR